MTPRLWTPLPAQHHRHPKMVELLELHGPSGPLAFLVLLGEAAAGVQGRDDKGIAEMSWREFARFAGCPRDDAPDRLRELASRPFSLVKIERSDDLGFRVLFPRWGEWDKMPKDPTGAERARRYRERKRDAPVTITHRTVTGQGQTTREEDI